MTTFKNNGGNRALVAYLYASELFDEEIDGGEIAAFDSVIDDVLKDVEYSDGGTIERIIDAPRTVDVALTSGDWKRCLKIGECSGELFVGVYFYDQPAPPPAPETIVETPEGLDDDSTEIFEQDQKLDPSIPQLVCDALRAAFPDALWGVSAFVIDPGVTEFELEIE